MAKTGKIVRWNEWQQGRRFKSGHKRGEKVIDMVGIDDTFYYCRHSHRATQKTHPLGSKGSHYWQRIVAKRMDILSREVYTQFARLEDEVLIIENKITKEIEP